jgi:biopolymer transport protein ExbD
MTRRGKHRPADEINLNLAAMLDMAFQLLTFFILTFKPAPAEGNIQMRMPQIHVGSASAASQPAGATKGAGAVLDEGLRTLVITADANATGDIAMLTLGSGAPVGNLARLDGHLRAALLLPDSPFDQIVIQAASGLRYDALMSVVEVCALQKLADGKQLKKLSFVELPSAGL